MPCAGASRHRAGIQYHGGPSALVQAGQGVLEPRPVALAGGDAPGGAEAVEGVVLEDVLVEVLVPHGIGDHDVVAGDAARGVLDLGLIMVSPRSIWTSMSWMMAFMWATA